MGDMRITLDEALLVLIEKRARLQNHSVEDEVIELLRKGVEKPREETLYEASIRITAMTPRDVQQTDSLEMLREDRAR
ncbi:hypothetical protein [Rhizobium sp. CC-YZS058]|uniref:hypothetical protein n=1 Tax=Rhizobium sp. CC-YZS058 TaxID=3042153 RepID=UPI002B05625D|nr:hypothetical protein [Rhizobium sp. CC-YZS058]MEA3536535.1 hypothetical protein [Rhizobium sp. CC-YZS058]